MYIKVLLLVQQEDGFCATRRSVHCTVLAWGDTTLVSAPAQQLDGFRWVERGGGPTTCDGPIKCMAQYSDNAESVWAGGCSVGEAYRWQNKLSRSRPTNKPDPSWSFSLGATTEQLLVIFTQILTHQKNPQWKQPSMLLHVGHTWKSKMYQLPPNKTHA